LASDAKESKIFMHTLILYAFQHMKAVKHNLETIHYRHVYNF